MKSEKASILYSSSQTGRYDIIATFDDIDISLPYYTVLLKRNLKAENDE